MSNRSIWDDVYYYCYKIDDINYRDEYYDTTTTNDDTVYRYKNRNAVNDDGTVAAVVVVFVVVVLLLLLLRMIGIDSYDVVAVLVVLIIIEWNATMMEIETVSPTHGIVMIEVVVVE